jgi:group I intron endonuclease
MSEKQFNYVYLTTNLITRKQYVGDHSTNNLSDSYIGSGRPYLLNAVKKYGKSNFKRQILEQFNSKKEAFDNQKKYIEKYNTLYPNGYNLNITGGLQCSEGWSEEAREKMGEKQKGKKAWNKGLSFSKEIKDRMSISKTGINHTEEHNKNIGKGIIGKNKNKERTEEFKENVRKFQTGRKKSKLTKGKIGKSIKEGMTQERKDKISRGGMGRIPWNKGKILKK